MLMMANAAVLLQLTMLACNAFGFAAKLLGEIKRVEALLGGKVMMPCDVTSSTTNDTLLLLVWYKGNRPFYSFDGRLMKHWRSSDFYQNDRIIFTFHTEPAALLMDRINLDDEGTYRCRVDFSLSPTRNIGIYLYVIIVPSKPFFMDEIGTKVENSVGPFHEGDTLMLTCLVVGGKPTPKLSWWKSNTLLDSTDEPSEVPGVMENQLLLTLTREFAGAKIHCQAINNNVTFPLTSSLDIELYVSPETVAILSSKQALTAGKIYELPCYVNGSYPLPKVSWWLDGKIITDQQIVTESTRNEVFSNLHFKPRIEHNGKTLTCLATNGVMAPNQASKLHTISLNVFFSPLLSLTLLFVKQDREIVKEGDTIHLRCMIEANPWITKTEWFGNNKTIQGNTFNGSRIIMNSSDLRIINVTKEHSGFYTCMAFNLEGGGRSNELYVKILYKPRCKMYNVIENKNVTHIKCPIDSIPRSTSYFWQIVNDIDASHNETIFSFSDNSMNLDAIANSTKFFTTDYIVFLCWAVNKVGVQSIPCKITWKQTIRIPLPPKNCKLESNGKSMTVNCSAEQNTEKHLEWYLNISVWQVTNNTKILINNITSHVSIVNIDNLDDGELYEIFLFTFNKWGRSEIVKLSNLPKYTYIYGKIPFHIGVSSGVFIALILIVSFLVFIIVFKKRKKARALTKTENCLSKNKKKTTSNKSVNAALDMTEKPLLSQKRMSSSNSSIMRNNYEPKNAESIDLVQTNEIKQESPPPVSRCNKPKYLLSNTIDGSMQISKNGLQPIVRNGNVLRANENIKIECTANIKLFNMSRESIV